MGFDKHLFISYAHIDNQPLTPEQQGWISRFHKSLEAMPREKGQVLHCNIWVWCQTCLLFLIAG
jgi:hypothetical protein